ncbi:hypothetical protein AX15_006816 [Amanita polypyramis BW_CC]|nr:hypothetical protein AX15_006816 [Amanita polypyramis BW_CC]
MQAFTFNAYIILLLITSIFARNVIVVTVGGNTPDNASKVFQPQSIQANQGDVVYFNFTQGNHTVTQSLFSDPCISAYSTNYTINSFDSGFRNAGSGSTYSDLLITVLNPDIPIWFFDFNTCAQGGVGVINPNSSETLQAFQDRAMTVNGTGVPRSSSEQVSATNSSSQPAQTHASNDATQSVVVGLSTVLSFTLLALSL